MFIKKNFFLILIFSFILLNITKVNAQELGFNDNERIPNTYISKYDYKTNSLSYHQFRVYRKNQTGEFVYCIEPFESIVQNANYNTTNKPNNLTEEQLDKIKKLAYYGYNYKDHTDIKWYAVTQILIWKEINKDVDFYFTDYLNGNRINIYQEEIKELNELIQNHNIEPSFSNKNYKIVEGKELVLEDENNVLNNYYADQENIKINNNTLEISNLKEGTYQIDLTKNNNYYNKPYIFYQSNNSQNFIQTGDIENINSKLNIEVVKTSLVINKIDSETKTNIPQGEASLNGAIIEVLDENNNKILETEIKNNKVILTNIDFGTYYINELNPGEGYNLNENTYKVTINKDDYKKEINIENEVIKKQIIIEKKYGEENSFNNESNITFEIYNNKNILIKTINTDEYGIAKLLLPYGIYTIKQINTTEGYQLVEPFQINIKDNIEEKIELKDYRIKIPDTYKNNNLFKIIILLILINLC